MGTSLNRSQTHTGRQAERQNKSLVPRGWSRLCPLPSTRTPWRWSARAPPTWSPPCPRRRAPGSPASGCWWRRSRGGTPCARPPSSSAAPLLDTARTASGEGTKGILPLIRIMNAYRLMWWTEICPSPRNLWLTYHYFIKRYDVPWESEQYKCNRNIPGFDVCQFPLSRFNWRDYIFPLGFPVNLWDHFPEKIFSRCAVDTCMCDMCLFKG